LKEKRKEKAAMTKAPKDVSRGICKHPKRDTTTRHQSDVSSVGVMPYSNSASFLSRYYQDKAALNVSGREINAGGSGLEKAMLAEPKHAQVARCKAIRWWFLFIPRRGRRQDG
jgi:hypothetical protein